MQVAPDKFIAFNRSITGMDLPDRFTFPFYYQPHPLSVIAAEELQEYIQTQNDWQHNFGLDATSEGMKIGKMFGVLVVQNKRGELGYLAAFSGKLGDQNDHDRFVPPIFDMLKDGGFYRQGERHLYALSAEIDALEQSDELVFLKRNALEVNEACTAEMQATKEQIKLAKVDRKIKRESFSILSDEASELAFEALRKQSISEQFFLKDLIKQHREKRAHAQDQLTAFLLHIKNLKSKRKEFSNALQNQLFDHYHFLNASGDSKSVLQLFEHVENGRPPSGAGECCAPKLLQYAYQHQLKPICISEFWWGISPSSEIRKHNYYYPACRGKCEPILGHMLQGLQIDPNPLLQNPAEGKELEIIYEDEVLLLINKPAEFLSVPGKSISDSVLSRMQTYLPDATGPLLVHRIDMSTSGLLLVAKTKEAHDYLQYQFIKRTIKKRYVALLDGVLEQAQGTIDLPLRVDLEDRPRQLVCFEHGKRAVTNFELIEIQNGKSLVYFYPVTGRTHQLRVHAAHDSGLGLPIVGDDLYGAHASRLHLHAEQLTFKHPISKELVTFHAKVSF